MGKRSSLAGVVASARRSEPWADPVECALGVAEDLFVGEAQDREACGAKQGVAGRIASSDAGVVVMAAINRYDEPSCFAEEVDDEAAQRLASELGVLELSAAK